MVIFHYLGFRRVDDFMLAKTVLGLLSLVVGYILAESLPINNRLRVVSNVLVLNLVLAILLYDVAIFNVFSKFFGIFYAIEDGVFFRSSGVTSLGGAVLAATYGYFTYLYQSTWSSRSLFFYIKLILLFLGTIYYGRTGLLVYLFMTFLYNWKYMLYSMGAYFLSFLGLRDVIGGKTGVSLLLRRVYEPVFRLTTEGSLRTDSSDMLIESYETALEWSLLGDGFFGRSGSYINYVSSDVAYIRLFSGGGLVLLITAIVATYLFVVSPIKNVKLQWVSLLLLLLLSGKEYFLFGTGGICVLMILFKDVVIQRNY